MQNHSEATASIAPLPKRVKNLTGVRRGLLVALKYIGTMENRHARWLCQCDCGNMHEVDGATFLRWMCRSCGCYRDKISQESHTTHGKTNTPEYQVWLGIIKRTEDPTHQSWKNYGGRGLKMCDKWRNSFEAFLADVGLRPSKGHSLDRLNNSLGYFPENCAWKTSVQQARNRRNNHLITYKNETITLAEMTERLGFTKHMLRQRLNSGMTVEEAVETPHKRQRKVNVYSFHFEWV